MATPAAPGPHLDGAGLIALDVDGTLLTSARRLSERTKAALLAAEGRGWHVVVATGRPVELALPVVHELGIGEFVIGDNGATIANVADRTLLHQATLPGWLVVEAIDRVRASIGGVGLAVTTGRGMVYEPGFERVAPLSVHSRQAVHDARPLPHDAVHNVVVFVRDAEPRRLEAQVRAILPDGVAVAASGLIESVELTPPGAHKGAALERLCGDLGIDASHVVAFGDGLNDLGMLTYAGWGVAMGNAQPELKAMADEVTASNDHDGIALVVERLLAAAAS